jgi:multidrug efflux pump subunit AcrA (membrane-fusion protein)
VGEVESGTTAPLPIESPRAGLLRSVTALPGQNVPAGAALFEVVDLTRIWVRVPVYVGDLPRIDTTAEAGVGALSSQLSTPPRPAQPATAPPSASAAAGTVDLFYELPNDPPALSPGQRVSVNLPLNEEAESLTAPWSAVVIDIYGGTWLYEQTAELEFIRRRALVRYVADDTAVLSHGPPPGTPVVVAGAAELFGTETGFTK